MSVVLRTYTESRWDNLLQAVESVQRQTVPPAEIVLVVDNNPSLYERARSGFPSVVVVQSRYPQGSSHAWNMGVETARGEIVAFIDDDAIAAADWLARLLAEYTSPEVVGVGGRIEPAWSAGCPAWFPSEFNWVVGCSYRGLPETVAPVRNLIGCNMSFRREALEKVGLFRTGYGLGHTSDQPAGCDETELCIRLRQRNPSAVLLHAPQAVVHHAVPGTRTTWQYFRTRCYLEGKSKAVVARLVGARQALATERRYTVRTLPRGMVRGLRDALAMKDLSGLTRAGAIAAGLSITAVGYLLGALPGRGRNRRTTAPAEFPP